MNDSGLCVGLSCTDTCISGECGFSVSAEDYREII